METETVLVDSLTVQEPIEPKWCLDRRDSGQLFWRRASGNSRVKFRCDVDVVEFHRHEHEMVGGYNYADDIDDEKLGGTHPIVMGFTCIVCIVVTMLVPYFIIG